MLVKDTAAGVIQQLESFTAKYFTDNQGYASPPTSSEWPRPRTLTGADIPPLVTAVNGYGLTAATVTGNVAARQMSITNLGAATTAAAATATTPLGGTFSTTAVASTTAGFQENFVGSRTLGILKSVKFFFRLQQTTNMRIWIGLTSATGVATFRSDTPNVQFCGFRYSTAAGDGTYQCVTQTSNVNSTKNAASPVLTMDTSPHILELQYDGTNMLFLIDGVQVGSQSGNLPSTSQAMCFVLYLDNVALTNNQKLDLYAVTGADFPTG